MNTMRITKEELMAKAQSNNPDERKRAFQYYKAWLKDTSLPPHDRINFTERYMLDQMFHSKGMTVPGYKPPPKRRPSVPQVRRRP